jgi:hypothetical protein
MAFLQHLLCQRLDIAHAVPRFSGPADARENSFEFIIAGKRLVQVDVVRERSQKSYGVINVYRRVEIDRRTAEGVTSKIRASAEASLAVRASSRPLTCRF